VPQNNPEKPTQLKHRQSPARQPLRLRHRGKTLFHLLLHLLTSRISARLMDF
jgi:hypothetical protein